MSDDSCLFRLQAFSISVPILLFRIFLEHTVALSLFYFKQKDPSPPVPCSLAYSVDKNCPLIKFVGQHGDSCLGHKLSNTLKNSEWQACRVATILGQCDPSSPVPCSLTYSPKTFNLSANKGQLPAEAPK